MDQLVDSSTYDKDVSVNSESVHSDLEHDLSSPEQATPVTTSHLGQTYSNINGLTSSPFINNPFTMAASPFSSVTGFNPLSLLQSTNGNLASAYPGLDTLTMATALQSASLGVYPSTGNGAIPSSSPWNKYFDTINNRKRRRAKTPPPTDSATSSTPEYSTIKQTKTVQSQPTSTSSAEKKDDGYWDRRRKNNEAAKRSRDAKRLKEVHTARKAEYLERENVELKAQINLLKSESANLQFLLFNNKLNGNQGVHAGVNPATSVASLIKRAV